VADYSATTWVYKDGIFVQKMAQMSENDDALKSSIDFLYPLLSITGTSVGATAITENITYNSGAEARLVSLSFTLSASAKVLCFYNENVGISGANSVTGSEMRFQLNSSVNFGSARFVQWPATAFRAQRMSLMGLQSLTGGSHVLEVQMAAINAASVATASHFNREVNIVIIPS